MTTTITHVTVKDYDNWRDLFDGLHDVRKYYGCVEERVWCTSGNRNEVTILMEWEVPEGPQAYMDSPEFKAIDPERAGWVGQPVFYFLEDAD